jgi:hypothetical protein
MQIRIVEDTRANALQRIKDSLRWSRNYPRIAITQERRIDQHPKIWIEEDFLHFLEGCFNAFIGEAVNGSKDPNSVSLGFGTVKDDFGEQNNSFNGPDRCRNIRFLQVIGG